MGTHETPCPLLFTPIHPWHADLQARLEKARLSVTHEDWEGAVRRAQDFKKEYWETDNVHDQLNPIIINLDSDDEDNIFLDRDDK